MSDPTEVKETVKKDRSPSYPFISLKRAIDRVRQVADAHKRNPARLQTVALTWGYGIKSSGLLQTVGALKQYGLVEDSGSGDDRKIQLSDLAWRILYDDRVGAKENGLQEAALNPRLFAECNRLWSMGRPSDAHCISELQFDRGFTGEAAKIFLKAFDETMSFVNLVNPDKKEPVGIQSDDDRESDGASGKSVMDTGAQAIRGNDRQRPAPLPAEELGIDGPFRLSATWKGIEGTICLRTVQDAEHLIMAVTAWKILLKPAEEIE